MADRIITRRDRNREHFDNRVIIEALSAANYNNPKSEGGFDWSRSLVQYRMRETFQHDCRVHSAILKPRKISLERFQSRSINNHKISSWRETGPDKKVVLLCLY